VQVNFNYDFIEWISVYFLTKLLVTNSGKHLTEECSSPTNRTVVTYCIVIRIILITNINLLLVMIQYITNYLLKNDFF
jgi:hypothetical protein